MRYLSVPAVVCACAAAHAQFGFVQRIDVPPPAKALDGWIAPGAETAHFLIRSESIMLGLREELGEHLEQVHRNYLNSLKLSAYLGSSPLASAEAAEKALAGAEKEGKLVRQTRHATVRILADRTLVSVREGGKTVVTFPDGSRASRDGGEWKTETPRERINGRCDVWLLPNEVGYRAFMASYYPDRNVTGNAFYDPDADRIVAWNSPDHKGAITGELARRLLSCVFGATPPWLGEGLSRLTRGPGGEVRPLPIETTRRLRYMVMKGAYLSVERLTGLNSAEFDDTVNRPLYALQSAGVAEFLMRVDAGKHFSSFLRKLREGVRQKDAFRASFAGARKTQNKWLQYLVNDTTKLTRVEGLMLMRTERRDAGAGRSGDLFTVRVRQRVAESIGGVELWVYMVVRPRNSVTPEGKLVLGRWTWDQLGKGDKRIREGDKKVSQGLSPEEREKWGDHPDIVRAELYWKGRLVDIDTNGQYTPLKNWWLLLEPVKWLSR